jgi:uncharacterized lipoprotein YddW (UPF0748 family)
MYSKSCVFASLLCLLTISNSCTTTKSTSSQTVENKPPKADAEFRAAWIATVANINWPSKPGLTTKEQQDEAIVLLDFLKDHNFNAAIFQVRPQCDALYDSKLEPWSYYLTGKQGKAPDPYYDPLQFWVEAAHDRGLELHVWLNPYRAHHISGDSISELSIVKKHPELVVKLKEGYWWMDPSKKGTRDHSTAVVMDILKRYDIDGVHFDDYFYPYPAYNKGDDFPDDDSWTEYQKTGGKLSRGDWRRQSVNQFIEHLYQNIKAEKPYVKFGLSPFGIWRPGYPESIEGFDQHNQLYADARLWLNKGWIDYFTPQLYWPIKRYPQSFPVLLGWWAGENTQARHLWPGISVGRDTSSKNVDETLNQIMISRGMLPASKGIVHWSISSLTRNSNMAEAVLNGPYKKQALVPASSWLDNNAPGPPVVSTEMHGDTLKVTWVPKDVADVFHSVVYYKYGAAWSYKIVNSKERFFNIANTVAGTANQQLTLSHVAVTTVDRTGNESALKEVSLNK